MRHGVECLDAVLCVARDAFEHFLTRTGLHIGLGLHADNIPGNPAWVQKTWMLTLFLLELFYAFTLACSKFAVLSFYWRMFHTSNLKVSIQLLLACTTIWLILRVRERNTS